MPLLFGTVNDAAEQANARTHVKVRGDAIRVRGLGMSTECWMPARAETVRHARALGSSLMDVMYAVDTLETARNLAVSRMPNNAWGNRTDKRL